MTDEEVQTHYDEFFEEIFLELEDKVFIANLNLIVVCQNHFHRSPDDHSELTTFDVFVLPIACLGYVV